MILRGTHRSIGQRLRLSGNRNLGAGNFFWHAWRVAHDRDRPLLHHPDVSDAQWSAHSLPAVSLDDIRLRVIRYAHWYRRRGVGVADHVGVYTRDGLLGLMHHIAITSLGAVAVHCNPRMAPDTAADYFRRTRVTVLVGDTGLLDQCVPVGSHERSRLVADVRAVEADAGRPPRPLSDFPYRHRPDDLIMISHSSGTTGRPKAPVFTHQGFFIGKRERLWTFPSLRSDRMLTALPHSHSAGISYLSMAMMLGIPSLILDGPDGARVAQAVSLFRPTFVLGFPLTLAEVRPEQIEPRAAAGIHSWYGMGDASHERHIRPLVNGSGGPEGSSYIDGLGSSEMGMVLFRQVFTRRSTEYGRLIGAPVRVVRRAAVLDDQGRELPPGQAGMLGVRTPSVTPGYWDDPALSEDSTSNGYLLTGDIVRRDVQGRWFHLDRTPDVIHTAGGPVYSLPLEEAVLLATGALDAAVIAVDDPHAAGRSAPAAIVLFEDTDPRTPAELLDICNTAAAERGLPPLRAMVVAAERADLPVGVTGKVLKRTLRQRYRELLSDPAGAAVVEGTRP